MVKQKKRAFFIMTLVVYIITLSILTFTVYSYKISSINSVKNLSYNARMVCILIGLIGELLLLMAILIIARLALILIFKFIYKGNYSIQLLNDVYFIATGLKLVFLIIGQVFILYQNNTWKLLANIVPIIFYIAYLRFRKNNYTEVNIKSIKNIFIQGIAGSLLIVAV